MAFKKISARYLIDASGHLSYLSATMKSQNEVKHQARGSAYQLPPDAATKLNQNQQICMLSSNLRRRSNR